jgi:hypothetical protein
MTAPRGRHFPLVHVQNGEPLRNANAQQIIGALSESLNATTVAAAHRVVSLVGDPEVAPLLFAVQCHALQGAIVCVRARLSVT